MLELRDIDISDKDRAEKALRQSDFMGCEYSFANNMAWKRLSDSKITFYKDFYITIQQSHSLAAVQRKS